MAASSSAPLARQRITTSVVLREPLGEREHDGLDPRREPHAEELGGHGQPAVLGDERAGDSVMVNLL
jgi:hypothetical protein